MKKHLTVMIKNKFIFLSLINLLFLSACGSDPLGLRVKNAPDEFQVLPQKPLEVPPSYALRPPKKAVTTVTSNARTKAKQTIFNLEEGQKVEPTLHTSYGEDQAFLKKVVKKDVDPNIRLVIEQETNNLSSSKLFAKKLLFWKNDNTRPATVLNAPEESKRMKENAILGKPITDGSTPMYETK